MPDLILGIAIFAIGAIFGYTLRIYVELWRIRRKQKAWTHCRPFFSPSDNKNC